MTYQQIVLSKTCVWCGVTMNHCGDRGQGKQRDSCNRTCQRKRYVVVKRVDNLMNQFELLNGKFETEGELTEECYKFIKLSKTYLDLGLPAMRLNLHLQMVLDGKGFAVESLFNYEIKLKTEKDLRK